MLHYCILCGYCEEKLAEVSELIQKEETNELVFAAQAFLK